MTALPFVAAGDGVRLAVRVTPRAKRTETIGLIETADGRPVVAIKLAAAPVDGAANQALADYLAKSLRLPRSAVRIVSGGKSRVKQVALTGLSPERLVEWLDRLPNP